MIPRTYQRRAVDKSCAALDEHGNTLLRAATGAGKTIMLSLVLARYLKDKKAKGAVMAHRDELTEQNRSKFHRVNPGIASSVYDGDHKDWSGRAVFGMVQSMSTDGGLAAMPPLDILVIDECHHAVAPGYRKVIDAAMTRNPDMKLFGVTATPARGDGKGLREAGFTNVADEISFAELVASGHLVPPRTFIIDLGKNSALRSVNKSDHGFDNDAVAAILQPALDAIIDKWFELADGRDTIWFAPNVAQSIELCERLKARGLAAEHIDGTTKGRKAIIERCATRQTRHLVNVGVATEGYDNQAVSCVCLLRMESHISTFQQMAGRGARPVDPELHPGLVKKDFIILDFGLSSEIHKTLEQQIQLESEERGKGEGPVKVCKHCDGEVPAGCKICPLCGSAFEEKERTGPVEISDFIMTEIDLLNRSPFQWEDLFGDESSLIATGFNSWAGVFWWGGEWHAIGGYNNHIKHLAIGEKTIAIAAADDFMLDHESDDSASKKRKWLTLPPTEKQMEMLRKAGYHVQHYPEAGAFGYQPHLKKYARADLCDVNGNDCSRYRAACYLTFMFNKKSIMDGVQGAKAA